VRANPLYRDVKSAPFSIGERVRIVGSEDDTFDPVHCGRVGIVKYLEYECGCGQSYPLDPMIGIEFDDRTIEEFWREELSRYPDSPRKTPVTISAADRRHVQETQLAQGREEPVVAGGFSPARGSF